MRKDHSYIRMKPHNFIQYFGPLFDRILTVVKTVYKSKNFYISVNTAQTMKFSIKIFLRILTGKKAPSNKTQALRKVRTWAFGMLVH